MAHRAGKRVLGKWRIFESDLWDTDFLDLVEPAYVRFDPDGHGEFMFGGVTGSIDCHYGSDGASFTWVGFDEMDEVSGEGDAEFDDGVLTIELSFHHGDEAVLKARRWPVVSADRGASAANIRSNRKRPRSGRPRS